MNDLYEKTIEIDGKTYAHDPDQDVYYRKYGPMSTFDKYAWIVTIMILLAIVLFLEWYK